MLTDSLLDDLQRTALLAIPQLELHPRTPHGRQILHLPELDLRGAFKHLACTVQVLVVLVQLGEVRP